MYCKEWKQASLIESHQKSCTYNNKENEDMRTIGSHQASSEFQQVATSSKKNSLLQTINTTSLDVNAKQKRLRQFKLQMQEKLEKQTD